MKKGICIVFILLAIILAVISWFVLPEMVVIQVNIKGEASNTVPKLIAIIIPAILTLAGSIMGLKDEGENGKKAFLLSIVGIGVALITMIFNR